MRKELPVSEVYGMLDHMAQNSREKANWLQHEGRRVASREQVRLLIDHQTWETKLLRLIRQRVAHLRMK